MSITVRDLVDALPRHHHARLVGDGDAVVIDATLNSREVDAGWLFLARPGEHADGHDYAPGAVDQGAVALVVERELDLPVPQIVVDHVADVVGDVAGEIHGHPSRTLKVIGITGTNGKTTTTWMIHQIVTALGMGAGLIGTVEAKIGHERIEGIRTTPEATDLQRLLARMRDAGVDVVAMEVSSHGIDLGRINGLTFEAVGFTNLTQDHLDYHHSMEEYARVKASLFASTWAKAGAIVLGDPKHPDAKWTDYVHKLIQLPYKTISQYQAADVNISNVTLSAVGSSFTMDVAGTSYEVSVPLPGQFNIDNAALALTLCSQVGLAMDACVQALANSAPTPGRAERVQVGDQGPVVIVDYAHTPDALTNVLASLAETTQGKLICVVGCGGDRDREKRPLMAQASLNGATMSYFTSDNPRTEDPDAILDEMTAGLAERDAWVRITDRRAAITAAIEAAQPEDVVVIAGKGHETYQEVNGVKHHFDDREEARAVLTRGGAV